LLAPVKKYYETHSWLNIRKNNGLSGTLRKHPFDANFGLYRIATDSKRSTKKTDRVRTGMKNVDANQYKYFHDLSVMKLGRMYIIQQQECLGETSVVSRTIQWH